MFIIEARVGGGVVLECIILRGDSTLKFGHSIYINEGGSECIIPLPWPLLLLELFLVGHVWNTQKLSRVLTYEVLVATY